MKKQSIGTSAVILLVPALRTFLFIGAGLLLLVMPSFRAGNLIDTSMWWPLLCIGVNVITILFLFLMLRIEGKSFRTLLNHAPDRKKTVKEIFTAIPLMLVLGIGGLVGISWLVYGYMPVTNTQPLPVWAAIVVVVLLPATIVFSEIPFYLGYCAPRIREKTRNDMFAIAYPLFFYALQHSFMPLLFDFQHVLSRFLMFIPLLMMIGIWYFRKKDLVPLMAGHGLLDLFTGIQLLVVALYPSIFEMMRSAN